MNELANISPSPFISTIIGCHNGQAEIRGSFSSRFSRILQPVERELQHPPASLSVSCHFALRRLTSAQ
jgi:hypothetical protein